MAFTSSKLLAHHRLICSMEPKAKKPRNTGHPNSPSQVGRGHRTSLANTALEETFTPTHNQDTITALKEVEPHIMDSMTKRLGNGVKWYLTLNAEFTKMVKHIDRKDVERNKMP